MVSKYRTIRIFTKDIKALNSKKKFKQEGLQFVIERLVTKEDKL